MAAKLTLFTVSAHVHWCTVTHRPSQLRDTLSPVLAHMTFTHIPDIGSRARPLDPGVLEAGLAQPLDAINSEGLHAANKVVGRHLASVLQNGCHGDHSTNEQVLGVGTRAPGNEGTKV